MKLYSGEGFEVDQYRTKIVEYQRYEWESLASLTALNTGQALIIAAGMSHSVYVAGNDCGISTVATFC